MGGARRLFAVMLATLVGGSCTPGMRSHRDGRGAATSASPVALITDGSAFRRPDVRERVRRALEDATGRPVVVLDEAATANDPDVKHLAGRLLGPNGSVASYDWTEPRCRKDGLVLTAVARAVDAVYRVSLDYAERIRPATEVERARRAGVVRALLAAVRLVTPGSVREETVSGSVVLSGFAAGTRPQRIPITRTATRVEPTPLTARLDAVAVVAEVLRAMPAAPAPEWASLARHLVSSGCPFLALALSETRLAQGPVQRKIQTAALAQMRRRAAPRRAPERVAPEPAPAEPADGDGRSATARYDCSTLCGMHMIEICNQDKGLWEAHRTPWRPTPCGIKRTEDFLTDCYRWQWLSGSYHDSCLGPCEATPEGHDRLLGILQAGGCVRLRRSS